MVFLEEVRASNARISSLPPGLVAVFVGGTSGIGETTLKQFAKYARSPRVYFVGRSQEAADRIVEECTALNPDGKYVFIKADTGLIKNVDAVCRDIKSREEAINLLFLSTGTMIFGTETSEGLQLSTSLLHYSRARFITNLLPLIQRATALRRVVTVAGGTKEGPLYLDDLQGWKMGIFAFRGHGSSLITLSVEALARRAPDVSFIHDHPGTVKTGLGRDAQGMLLLFLKAFVDVFIIPFVSIDIVEAGERHLYFATSARYPAGEGAGTAGVPLVEGGGLARGTDGEEGSGTYSIQWDGESAGPVVEKLLAGFRKDGAVEKVWDDMESHFKRIGGAEAA